MIHAPQNLVVIHKSDGARVWEKTFTNSYPASLSAPYPLSNGVVYVNAQTEDVTQSTIFAFAVATGHMLWQAAGGSMRFGSPIVLGKVVVTANGGMITAFDTRTGSVVWSKQLILTTTHGTIEFITPALVPAP